MFIQDVNFNGKRTYSLHIWFGFVKVIKHVTNTTFLYKLSFTSSPNASTLKCLIHYYLDLYLCYNTNNAMIFFLRPHTLFFISLITWNISLNAKSCSACQVNITAWMGWSSIHIYIIIYHHIRVHFLFLCWLMVVRPVGSSKGVVEVFCLAWNAKRKTVNVFSTPRKYYYCFSWFSVCGKKLFDKKM